MKTVVKKPFIPTAGRTCGDCTACCRAIAVEALGKPRLTHCKHQDKGCAIYESRPQQCRAFACLWLMGIGADDARPDKTGVVLLSPPAGKGESLATDTATGKVYNLAGAQENVLRAADSELGRRAIQELLDHKWAVLVLGEVAREVRFPGGNVEVVE